MSSGTIINIIGTTASVCASGRGTAGTQPRFWGQGAPGTVTGALGTPPRDPKFSVTWVWSQPRHPVSMCMDTCVRG